VSTALYWTKVQFRARFRVAIMPQWDPRMAIERLDAGAIDARTNTFFTTALEEIWVAN
jgi:hypothetical protein